MRHILTGFLFISLILSAAAQGEEPTPPTPPPIQFEKRITPRATFLIDPDLQDTVQPLIDRMLLLLNVEQEQQATLQATLAHAPEYIRAMNRLLGQPTDDGNLAEPTRLLRQMLGQSQIEFAGPGALSVTIVDRANGLAFLRAGGTLPHTEYDKATDSARIRMDLVSGPNGHVAKIDHLVVSVKADSPIERAGDGWFSLVDETALGGYGTGVALTSVAEAWLMNGWADRRSDPHWRWFSVGVASAVAYRAILEVAGEEAANQYAEAFAPNRFDAHRRNVNLRYWLEKQFAPEVSLRDEQVLTTARQAFAFELMQQIIDTHGTDWIATTLSDLNQQDTVSTDAVIASIRKQAGVDVKPLLDGYQNFRTLEEAITTYTQEYETALGAEQYDKAASAAIRLLELRFTRLDTPEVGTEYERIAKAFEALDKPRDAKRVRALAPKPHTDPSP